jgi:2-succinyl-5-enolpyruvyl-6-hydroxy-3-cyclohexene-1-carboxylate synthase
MPVRDAEYFQPPTNRAYRPYFNRGANGIDGTLSTALGIAHTSSRPAVLLTGDLSLLHDTNALLLTRAASPRSIGRAALQIENRKSKIQNQKASGLRGSLTIVLINNNGGGIFEHLPVAQFDPPFERYIAAPQNIDFSKLCATYNIPHTLIKTWPQFTNLISVLPPAGVRVLEIRTDRKRDPARRKTLLAQAGK